MIKTSTQNITCDRVSSCQWRLVSLASALINSQKYLQWFQLLYDHNQGEYRLIDKSEEAEVLKVDEEKW
jgi:hypothetical protein